MTIKKALSYLLIAIGVVAAGVAIWGMVELVRRGYSYACIGQGCPYQTPGAVPWIYYATVGTPVAICSLLGGFMLRKFSGGTSEALGPVSSLAPAGSWPWAGGQATPAASGGVGPLPNLVSSYAAGEPGPTTRPWQDALQRGGMVGTSNFQKVTKNVYLGTAIFELVLATGFVIGALTSRELRFGFGLTAFILGTVGVVLLYAGGRARRRVQDAERLQQEGVRGEATIAGLEQTGVWMNNNPLVGIDAVIEVPGKAPYRIKKREYVPQVMLGSIPVGGRLPVLVDPRDAGNVLFAWDMG